MDDDGDNNNNNGGGGDAGGGTIPNNYYEVLEVPFGTSDSNTIRKAYLKKSLKYHPDKNPGREDDVRPYFVMVGEAYETLRDPDRRRDYDQELLLRQQQQQQRQRQQRRGRNSYTDTDNDYTPRTARFSFRTNYNRSNGSDDSTYETYRDVFDETVASMTEEELAATIGVVTAVAGIVGSFVGSKILGGGGGGGGHNNASAAFANIAGGRRSASSAGGRSVASSFLAQAGSVVGSVVATELAVSSVRALHRESIERLEYKEECRRAVERGEPIPERRNVQSDNNNNNNNTATNVTAAERWKTVIRKTVQTVQSKVVSSTSMR